MEPTNNSALSAFLSVLTDTLSTEELLLSHYMSDIAVAITSKRMALGLTQKEFADSLGKSQTMISNWESATGNFTLKTLVEIAQKLNLTLDIVLKSATPTTKATVDLSNIIKFPGGYSAIDSGSPTWLQGHFGTNSELIEM